MTIAGWNFDWEDLRRYRKIMSSLAMLDLFSDKPKEKKLIKEASKKVLRPYKSQIRKGTPRRSGVLQASLRITVLSKRAKSIGAKIAFAKVDWAKYKKYHYRLRKIQKLGVNKKWKAFYGRFVEMGTHYQPAQEFMGRVIRPNRKQILSKFEEEIARLVRKSVK